MKDIIINDVIQSMLPILDNEQLEKLKEALSEALKGKTIVAEEQENVSENGEILERFISSKRIEGCSEKSLFYYKNTINQMLQKINKQIKHIVTDDLRDYLMAYQSENEISKVTIDNIRRILSSFFSWLEDEDYILKSPVRRIHKIKATLCIKDTYTDEELELMRDNCQNARDLAIIDMLVSTGMRVGEMVLLDKSDINFTERECVVLGKGDKERTVYFDARTKIHLQNYLSERKDTNEALFVSDRKPYKRLLIGGVETMIRNLGKKVGIKKAHPHKFRRTLATGAIDKGMPIEQLQQLLGHKRIDTTLMYAMVKQSNVKMAHRKYIG
jgi:site-specific recombinase XerD